MKGTPPQANEPERGSIKNLRLTETDRRKRTAAASKQRAQSPQKAEAKKAPQKAAGNSPSGSTSANGTNAPAANAAGNTLGAPSGAAAVKSPRPAGSKRAPSSEAPPLPLLPSNELEDGPGDGPPPSIVVHLMMGPPKRSLEAFASVDSKVSGSGNSGDGEAWDLVTSPVNNKGENGTTVGVAEASIVVDKLRGLVEENRKQMGEDLAAEVKTQLDAWKVAKNGSVPSLSLVRSMQACHDSVAKRQPSAIHNLTKLCEDASSAHFVSASLLQSARNAEANLGCAAARETLLKALDEVMGTEVNPGTPRTVATTGLSPERCEELLDLVQKADFHDARLDYTCRRLLGVQMTAASTIAAAEKLSWDI